MISSPLSLLSMNISDLTHAAATHGVDVDLESVTCEGGRCYFRGVNYAHAETTKRDYVAYREDGECGIRIRQVRKRSDEE